MIAKVAILNTSPMQPTGLAQTNMLSLFFKPGCFIFVFYHGGFGPICMPLFFSFLHRATHHAVEPGMYFCWKRRRCNGAIVAGLGLLPLCLRLFFLAEVDPHFI